MGSKSHLNFIQPLAEQLCNEGHSVTFVKYTASPFHHDNYTEIIVQNREKNFEFILQATAFGLGEISLAEKFKFFQDVHQTIHSDYIPMCARAFLDSPQLMAIIKTKPKFDAVVTMWKCGAILAYVLDVPLVWFSTASPEAFPYQLQSLGGKINSNIQPNIQMKSFAPMSISERLTSILISTLWGFQQEYLEESSVNNFRKLVINDIPDATLIARERAIFLISNSHIATHGSWPYHENVINVGGMHCREGQQLPDDLQHFMDSHPEGVVYVSFGSMFKASSMTWEQKLTFYEAFKELNTPIIWKWNDGNVTDIPKNVRIATWLPQNDLLAHPNLKVFVTHGGLLSLQEAIFHKAILVGIPLGMDQGANVARAEKNGFAISLDFKELTKEKLTSAIRTALTDEKMIESMDRIHHVFTSGDSPMKRAIRTIERVMTDPGLIEMKPISMIDIPFHQYFGIDLIVLVIFIVIIIGYTMFKL